MLYAVNNVFDDNHAVHTSLIKSASGMRIGESNEPAPAATPPSFTFTGLVRRM